MSVSIQIINLIFSVYRWLLIIRVLTSWVPPQNLRHPIFTLLYNATEPVLSPVRRYLPNFGGMDFSPVIAFLALELIQGVLVTILASLGV